MSFARPSPEDRTPSVDRRVEAESPSGAGSVDLQTEREDQANESPHVLQLKEFQALADRSQAARSTSSLQALLDGPFEVSVEPVAQTAEGGEGEEIVQRVALYHGTTIKNANKILQNGIDPEQGGGEFGLGFYTVFSEQQAKHIAMYYWDKEQKYQGSQDDGPAVIKISIPDDWWKTLMSTSDSDYSVVHKNEDEWFNAKGGPFEDRDAEEELEVEEDEEDSLDEREDGLSWMPRREQDLEYEEDRAEDLGNDITIGAVKDKQTPYLQAVLGKAISLLLDDDEEESEVVTSLVWSEEKDGPVGSDVYGNVARLAKEELGSLVRTDKVKSEEFIAGAAGAQNRYGFVQGLFGGINTQDIPKQADDFLYQRGVAGEDAGERIYNYIQTGLPPEVQAQEAQLPEPEPVRIMPPTERIQEDARKANSIPDVYQYKADSAAVSGPVMQRVLTTDDKAEVDDEAFRIAARSSKFLRPKGQKLEKRDRGESQEMDANTRVRGAQKERLAVDYYSGNEGFSNDDKSTRLGQMSALFVHELSYHGNRDVVDRMGTDDETTPEEEHVSMFAPATRDRLLLATVNALRNLPDPRAQVEMVLWWEKDVKEHAKWALEDREIRKDAYKEARAWAEKTSSKLIDQIMSGNFD